MATLMSPAHFRLGRSAVKSRSSRFGAMLNVWSLSVPRRGNDPPDHFLTLLDFEFPRSFNENPVLAHQSPDPAVPDIDADFLQLFGHPGAAVAAQAQPRLLLDVRQNNHVHVLPAAGGAAAERPQPARADIQHPAQTIDREGTTLFLDEPEPYGFRLAKNWVAFFRMSPFAGKTVHWTVF